MFDRLACLLLVALMIGAPAQAEPRPMSPVDFIEFPRLSAPALSPTGQHLAYLRSETLWAENKIINRLEIIDIETGALIQGPDFGDATADASEIWWHPDGQSFIYLKPAGGSDKNQAHLFDLKRQDSTPLPQHRAPVLDILWRPDGSGFFYIAPQQQPKSDAALLSDGWIIPPFESNANREIWSFDLESGEAKPEVTGPFSMRQVSLARDGKTLVYSRVPNHALNEAYRGEVILYDIETEDSLRRTGNRFGERIPRLSPDGKNLAFIATVNASGEPYHEPKVFIAHPEKPMQRLLGDLPMEALNLAWDKTGVGLYILGNTGLSADLYHYQLETGALTALTRGDHNIRTWIYDAERDTHLAQFETANDPGDFYLMRNREEGFRRISSVYADWPAQFQLPRQEKVTWRGRRSASLEGVLVYPLDYQPGQAYPLVTITHGGPRTSSRFGSWNTSRYLPVLAAQGYMVFLPNHRGGTGYGDDFVRDMFGAYFRNAHHDVMDGIDALIDRGLADPDRLVKMGWSAGGHMVNKLITHTDRFAAASSGAGASDWRSMQGETDIRHHRQFVFGGEPWTRRAPNRQYNRDSPLQDAWKVTTPTLFFVGENDVRVPPTQSILMYRGVRATGTPTVLFQAEDEPHNFRKPANQLFKINTELGWYARFALGESYTSVLPDEAYVENGDAIADAEAPAQTVSTTSP